VSDLETRIRLRCVECGDCLLWQGWTDKGGRPMVRIGGRALYLRRLLFLEGGELPEGHRVTMTCESKTCVNRKHMTAMTASEISLKASRPAIKVAGMHSANAQRRTRAKLTAEAAASIRQSEASHAIEAAKHNVSRSLVQQIRQGLRWKDYSSPFAGLGAR
jgi:hypothetical protein